MPNATATSKAHDDQLEAVQGMGKQGAVGIAGGRDLPQRTARTATGEGKRSVSMVPVTMVSTAHSASRPATVAEPISRPAG